MHKIITIAAFLALVGVPAALAQSGTNAGSGSSATQSPRNSNSAPIGHRQPRASDVPSENSQNGNPAKIDADEAALDRKIKSICRGC